MSNEINRKVHEAMGNCWHDNFGAKGLGRPFSCSKCDQACIADLRQDNPDYCSDLNAIHKVEMSFDDEKAIRFWLNLGRVVRKPSPNGGFDISEVDKVRATAEQRAIAVLKTLGADYE